MMTYNQIIVVLTGAFNSDVMNEWRIRWFKWSTSAVCSYTC